MIGLRSGFASWRSARIEDVVSAGGNAAGGSSRWKNVLRPGEGALLTGAEGAGSNGAGDFKGEEGVDGAEKDRERERREEAEDEGVRPGVGVVVERNVANPLEGGSWERTEASRGTSQR